MADVDTTTASDSQVADRSQDKTTDGAQNLSQQLWDHIKGAFSSKDDASSSTGDQSNAKTLDCSKPIYGDDEAGGKATPKDTAAPQSSDANAGSNPAAQQKTDKPTDANAGSNPAAQQKTDKPTDANAGSNPAAQQKTDSPTDANAGSNPAAQQKTDSPTDASAGTAPPAQQKADGTTDTPPPPAAPVDQAAAQQSAKNIDSAMNIIRSDDYEAVQKELKGKSPDQLKAIDEAFKKDHDGKGVEDYLKDRWGSRHSDQLDKVEPLLHPLPEKAFSVPAPDYKGEGIKKDVTPDNNYLYSKGDKLEDIAKQKLGKDASDDDVQKYVKEVKTINHLNEDTNTVADNVSIKLPGHNTNGDIVWTDANTGAKRSTGQDGSLKVENKDGTSYEMKPQAGGGYSVHHDGPDPADKYDYTKTPDGKGGYVEHHTGSKPEDNYDVSRTPDGKYKIKDSSGEKTVDNFDKPQDPRVEQARTLDIAEQKITDPAKLDRFRDDMENFNDRARKQQVSPEEQGKFYNSVGKLMEAGDNNDSNLGQSRKDALPKEADRIKLAQEVMTHGAHPDRIDQGNHGTCGAAALESQMFTTHPGTAADMITKVATDGSFNGTNPDTSLLKPDAEAQGSGVKSGDRDYASQLFQDTAISMIHPEYHRVAPNPGTKPPDSGDRFAFGATKDDNPGLKPAEIQTINSKITGDTNPLTVIENSTQNPNDGQVHVKNQQELEQQLSQLKGPPSKLPAIMFVNSTHEPFFTDSNGGDAGGSGGGHFVTIRDYHPAETDKDGKVTKPASVEIANQWGDSSNHKSVSTQELFQGSKFEKNDAQAVADLKKVVAENRKNDQVDPVLEMELLRREKAAGIKNQAQYDKDLEDMMIAARHRWSAQQKAGTLDEDAKNRVEDSWNGIVMSLPDKRQDRINRIVNTKTANDFT